MSIAVTALGIAQTVLDLAASAAKAWGVDMDELRKAIATLVNQETFATDRSWADYQAEIRASAPAEDPEKAALRAQVADLQARLAAAAAPPEPSDR